MPSDPDFRGWRGAARTLRPSHQHSAFSATVLLMSAVMISRVVGYLREAYIAYAFGAGAQTDAYVAAFTLPDWLNYLVAGGTASITFVSIYSRYVSQDREPDAEKALSVVITVMSLVLVVGIAMAAIFTPQIERLIFPHFTAEQLALCVHLTRMLLPAQLFFYVGGVVSAVLLARRLFLYAALGPLLYNIGIIAGGLLLGKQLGISSLAVGAVAGAIAGPFLINVIGAARAGVKYRPSFDISHPGFREWVRLTIPLMIGVSLVTADDWILRFFASGGAGDITRLNYAKRLMAVPIAVLGQATGQASLPFFARLYGEKRLADFETAVNSAVFRIGSLSLLASAWMMAAALPIVDLVYRRGRFQPSDSRETAIFFFWFAISVAFWAAQGLYSRAYYAAGNTLTPMVAGTIITVLSLPLYKWMFTRYSVAGLAIASDIGIVAHTIVLAWLLHRTGLVRLSAMPWKEVFKGLLVAFTAAAAGIFAASRTGITTAATHQSYLLTLSVVTVIWAVVVLAGLALTRSQLLRELRTRMSRRTDPIEPAGPSSQQT